MPTAARLMAGHVNIVVCQALLPWFLLALDRLLCAPGPARAAGLALVTALLLLAGNPQLVYYAFFFGGLWTLGSLAVGSATGHRAGVLGWAFQPVLASPAGDYHLFAYSEQGGGGIRQTAAGEAPGSTPTVHVDDTDRVYQAALAAGAESIAEPHDIMPGVRIALVRAPGGVLLGLSGPTA